jgi:hypothetical protein
MVLSHAAVTSSYYTSKGHYATPKKSSPRKNLLKRTTPRSPASMVKLFGSTRGKAATPHPKSPSVRKGREVAPITVMAKRPQRSARTYYVAVYETVDLDPLRYKDVVRDVARSMRGLAPRGSPQRVTQKKASEMIDTHYHPMTMVKYGQVTSDFMPGAIAKVFYKKAIGEYVDTGYLTKLVTVYDPTTHEVTAFSNFKSFYANHEKSSLAMKTVVEGVKVATPADFLNLSWARSHGKFSVVK